MKIPLSSIVMLSAIITATSSLSATAAPNTLQESNTMPRTATTITTPHNIVSLIPETHHEVSQRKVIVDGETARLIRHERRDGRNTGLEGEHFSTVTADNGSLKGFANISLEGVGKPLPSRERAEAVARDFLKAYAPDLLSRMEIHWIDPHDESIRVQRDGHTEKLTLTGMKVKARNLADGRWFWVIVGADEKPMVFERDIVWINFPGRRKTEKWLHDAWLKEQGQTAGKRA